MKILFLFLIVLFASCKATQKIECTAATQKPKVSKITVELENGQTKDYYIELIQ